MKYLRLFKKVLFANIYFYKCTDTDGIHFTRNIRLALSLNKLSKSQINDIRNQIRNLCDSSVSKVYNDDKTEIEINPDKLNIKYVFCLQVEKFNPISKSLKINIISLTCAIVMAFSGIIIGNIPYNIGGVPAILTIVENQIRAFESNKEIKSDRYFINVSWDKQITQVKTPSKFWGNIAITDRKLLLDFLKIAEKSNYKFLFLDIRFEDSIKTKWDKALFEKIKVMPRLLYACHNDNKKYLFIKDEKGKPKYAYNDYKEFFFYTGFSKYQYLQDAGPSVALRMYEEIDNKELKKYGFFYINNGSLCENSPFIPIKETLQGADGNGNLETDVDYYDLGPFLMNMPESLLIDEMNDKIVIVGDFEGDKHGTYMGEQAGPYITYLAYKYLSEGKNKIPIFLDLILVVVFFFMMNSKLNNDNTTLIYQKASRIPLIKKMISNRFVLFCGSMLKHTIILGIICCIVDMLFGIIYNVLLPSIVLSSIDNFKNIKNINKEK